MKKLSLLLIAIFFSFMSVGNAVAEKPEINNLDRNAVWTNWVGHPSHDASQHDAMMNAGEGTAQKVSTKNFTPQYREGEIVEFDFVRETKYYDYSMERGKSS